MILAELYFYFSVITLGIIAVIWNRKDFPSIYLPMTFLLVTVLAVEGVKRWSALNVSLDYIMIFYDSLEYSFLAFAYYKVLKNSSVKKYILYSIVIFWVVAVLSLVFLDKLGGFSWTMLLSHIGILALAFYYMFELFKPPYAESSLYRTVFFWINAGNLLFYAGAFLQLTLSGYIVDVSVQEKYLFYYINVGLNNTMYILYLIGFLCQRIFK